MARTVARRTLLTASALALTGCGSSRLTVGQPTPYTPPPPGLDELVRTELVAAVAKALALVSAFDAASISGEPAAQAALTQHAEAMRKALNAHGLALRTTAENDRADGTFAPPAAATTAARDTARSHPDKLPGQIGTALADLRDAHARGALQVSDTLARVLASAGTWTTWALTRFTTLAGQLGVTNTTASAPTGGALSPTRKVPANDPPTAAGTDQIRSLLPAAQENEYFAAYVFEVIAAHRTGPAQKDALTESDGHASRAEKYGDVGAGLKLDPVARAAGYPLPFTTPSESALAGLEAQVTLASLTDAIALTGAAPFAKRAVFVETWLGEAPRYANLAATFEALPALKKRG